MRTSVAMKSFLPIAECVCTLYVVVWQAFDSARSLATSAMIL